jgi:hypothetical protein
VISLIKDRNGMAGPKHETSMTNLSGQSDGQVLNIFCLEYLEVS